MGKNQNKHAVSFRQIVSKHLVFSLRFLSYNAWPIISKKLRLPAGIKLSWIPQSHIFLPHPPRDWVLPIPPWDLAFNQS